jgi:hypothetical protein
MMRQIASGGSWPRWSPIIAVVLLLVAADARCALAREGAVGEAERVVSEVRGILGTITRELVVRDEVFSQEVIETAEEGATRIVFVDGTELSMGPNSRVTLDRYVYDPRTGVGELAMSFIGGVFEFASGLIPNTGYDLRTPFANLAIRGTVLHFLVFDSLQLVVSEGAIEAAAGGRVILLDDALDCLVWPGPEGEPAVVPILACETLIAEVAIMTALLVEPAAGPAPGPPAPQGDPIDPPFFGPPAPVSP